MREILATFLALTVGVLSTSSFLINIMPFVGILYLVGLQASIFLLLSGTYLLLNLDKR